MPRSPDAPPAPATDPGGGGAGTDRPKAGRPRAGRDVPHPKKLGRFTIRKELGAGGMGTVYLAEDTRLKRTVALKVLPVDRNTPPNLIARFESEAQAAAQLRHPGIVAIYDSGRDGDYLFLALEYVDGQDVERVMRSRGRLPPRRCLQIVRQVAESLEHLHETGIVHRDLKPSNFLIRRDGSVVLTDLGLARAVEEESSGGITRAGYTVGTVDYMPPEQAKNSRAADIRSDIYSLGCSWYHMATGKLPFPGDSLTARLGAHATQPPPDARAVYEDIPESHVAVMQRMMAKNPDERYQTPADLLADLAQAAKARERVGVDTLRGLADDWDGGPDPAADTATAERAGSADAAPAPAAERPGPPGRTRRRRRGAAGAAGAGDGPGAPRADRAADPDADDSDAADSGPSASDPGRPEPPAGRRRRPRPDADAADDSDPRVPRTEPGSRKGPTAAPPASGGSRPSKTKAAGTAVGKDGTPRVGVDAGAVRTVLVIAAALGALGLGGWAVARFAGAFDSDAAVIAAAAGSDADPDDATARGGANSGDDAGGPPPLVVRDAAGPRTPTAEPPAWAARARTDAADDPWAVVGPPPGRPPTVTVGPTDDGKNAARTLDAALRRLGARGGTVRLAGPGPFVLRTSAAAGAADLAILADGPAGQRRGPRPVVTVDFDGDGAGGPPARSRVLAGVDLVARPGPGGAVLFAADRVDVRDGSVTLLGDGPLTVAAVGGVSPGRGGDDAPRAFVGGAVFRGAGLRAVRTAGGGAEVVLRDSLFVTGGPLVTATADEPAAAESPAGEKEVSNDSKIADAKESAVWFDGATAVLGGPAVRLAGGADATLVLADAHLGVPAGAGAPFLSAGDDSAGDAAGPGVRLFASGSRLSGFSSLTDGGELADGPAVDAAVWPAALLNGSAAADPAAVAAVTPAPRGADRWAVPAAADVDRAAAWADRPGDVPPFPTGGPEIAVNLDRGRLDDAVKNAPDGARLTVRGSGPTDLPPVYVRGKAVQMTFADGERPLELRAGSNAVEAGEAAFTVVGGGRLRLVGGRFEFDRQRSGAARGPLVEVRDGTAELVRGDVRGTLNGPPLLAAAGAGSGGAGSGGAGSGGAGSGTDGRARLAVDRSLLSTPGVAVAVGRGARASVTGSLLVSPDAAVSLDGGTLLLDGGTLSAGDAFLRTGSGGGRVFVESTVFAPPPEGSRTADTGGRVPLLGGPPPDWWGTGNGYAGTVSLRGGPAEAGAFDAVFGRGHERDSAFGPAAVILAERRTPRWSTAQPAPFALTGGDAARRSPRPGIDPDRVGAGAGDGANDPPAAPNRRPPPGSGVLNGGTPSLRVGVAFAHPRVPRVARGFAGGARSPPIPVRRETANVTPTRQSRSELRYPSPRR